MSVAEERIRAVEARIVKNDYETAVAFDTDGNVVFEKIGVHDEVDFTPEDLEKLTGRIVTHNHPFEKATEVFGVKGTSSFSSNDLRTALKVGMIETRMVVDDERYLFRWNNPDKEQALDFLDEIFDLETAYELKIADAEPELTVVLDEFDANPCPRTQLDADRVLTKYYQMRKDQYDHINELISNNQQIGYTFRKECTQ
jgi:hypothetical protein